VDDENESQDQSDPQTEPDPPDEPVPTEQTDTYFQLSPQAVTSQFSPQTLKFQGWILGQAVTVLKDTGSTHNILQHYISSHLNLTTDTSPQFFVMIRNGAHLDCQGTCLDVPITLQGAKFNLPFYLFPIVGADVVLGIAWLRTIGSIHADFYIPSITFLHQNNPVTLTGNQNTHPTQSTFTQLCQLVHTDSVVSFHLLTFQPLKTPQPTPPTENNSSLTTDHCQTTFQLPNRFQYSTRPTSYPSP